MRMNRYFLAIFFVSMFHVSLATDLAPEKAKFVYDGKLVALVVSSDKHYTKIVSKKYGGKVEALDVVKIDNFDVWIGNFKKNDSEFSKFGIFYFSDDSVKRIIDAPLGFFVAHNGNYYASIEDLSNQHAAISILYKIEVMKNNQLIAKEVFRLPGYINNFNLDHEKLIVSGYVNTLPFALSINADGIWSELKCVESRKNE